MNAATLTGVAARRSAMYWLLAEFLLTCPNQTQVERLREDLAGSDAGEADADPLAAGLSVVRAALPEHTDAAAVDQLAVEYTRLFSAISPNYGLPPPYESVQRKIADPAELAAAVSACYSNAGFEPIDRSVPPDHLGVEMRFMAMLCHDEMQQWQSGDPEKAVQSLGMQREFLDDHLLQWAPGYLKGVQMQARHAFFCNVAALGIDVIPADRELAEFLYQDHT